jgi:hypothetical protein
VLGWNCRKVIEGFVDAGRETRGRHIVTEYSLIHHLGEEAGLRSQLLEHVRNILLPFGCEGLLIASASAKRNHYDLSLLCRSLSIHKWAGTRKGTS